MNAPINPQIIKKDGMPAFAVIPWDEYEKLIAIPKREEPDIYFPHEVVKNNALGDSLIKAWRKYLGITQVKLADLANMKQSSLARIESGKNKPKFDTLKKLAKAMNIETVQLID